MNQLDEYDKVLLRKAMIQLDSANAVMRFLSDMWREKYSLNEENQITPDGVILGPTKESWNGDSESSDIGALQRYSGVQSEG